MEVGKPAFCQMRGDGCGGDEEIWHKCQSDIVNSCELHFHQSITTVRLVGILVDICN